MTICDACGREVPDEEVAEESVDVEGNVVRRCIDCQPLNWAEHIDGTLRSPEGGTGGRSGAWAPAPESSSTSLPPGTHIDGSES